MRDGIVRMVVKRVALAWFFATRVTDRALARVAGRTPYLLGGDCKRCGECCESPSVHVGWATWYFPTWRRLFLAWQSSVNGFVLCDTDRDARVFVFRCTHFDAATRRCDSYASRPGMCRDYPRVLLYQPDPELLAGCGYRPVAPNAKRFLHVLNDYPLTEEQKARLKKGLFLE